jgi:hypothetical protein
MLTPLRGGRQSLALNQRAAASVITAQRLLLADFSRPNQLVSGLNTLEAPRWVRGGPATGGADEGLRAKNYTQIWE